MFDVLHSCSTEEFYHDAEVLAEKNTLEAMAKE